MKINYRSKQTNPSAFLSRLFIPVFSVFLVQPSLQPAHGEVVVGVFQQSVSNQGAGRAGNEPEYNYSSTAPTGGASGAYTSPGGFAYVESNSSFGATSLQLERVSPVAPGVFTGPYAFTFARSYWQDEVQINSSTLTGQIGYVNVGFTISGSATSSGGSQVDTLEFRFLFGNANSTYDAFAGERVFGAGILNTQQVRQFPFRFGEPFTLALTISGRVSSFLDTPGQAAIELGQNWGGFLSVTNGTGELLTPSQPALGRGLLNAPEAPALTYSTTSTSGADYSQPISTVPEPSTWLMLGGGLLALVITNRRKSGQRQAIS